MEASVEYICHARSDNWLLTFSLSRFVQDIQCIKRSTRVRLRGIPTPTIKFIQITLYSWEVRERLLIF